jgi:hypothetical protein
MMKRSAKIAAILLAVASAAAPLAAQPVVSEKKQIAIFALGYYGWSIPQETLGNIDLEIRKVFTDLGRFDIIPYAQSFSSGGVEQFVAAIKKSKEANFVMPEKYQFGEAILTEADFNKLLGAFIVATPVVGSFNSAFNQKTGYWETEIKTFVTFIDVAAGSTLGIAEVSSSGSDKQNQMKSIGSAIEGIPGQLQFEIRKIPAFQINTRILTVNGKEVKLQLGQDMGIRKGDEYSIIVGGMVEGFKDEREAGLIAIKDVGAQVSTGQVVYSSVKLAKDAQLREIPRQGFDAEPFVRYLMGESLDNYLDETGDTGSNLLVGLRIPLSRGFYGLRPYAEVETCLNGWRNVLTAFMIPINAVVGAEYRMDLGRLGVTPYGGIGGSYIYLTEALSGTSRDTSDTYLAHLGAQAYLNLSFLVTRDIRVFAEVGGEYWLSMSDWLYSSYGGVGGAAGVSFKL